MSKREVMSAEELAGLVFLKPDESLNGVERWRLVVPSDTEEWRSDYLVSTEGRVVRVVGGKGTRPGTVLRMPRSGDGYPTVCLAVDGERHTYHVHKLVARTFHGPAPSDEYGPFIVHHRNSTRHDNRAVNLQWISAGENAREWWRKRMSGR